MPASELFLPVSGTTHEAITSATTSRLPRGQHRGETEQDFSAPLIATREPSASNDLKHLATERQIRHQLLQLSVFILALLQTTRLRRPQAIVLLLPVAVRRLADRRLRQMSTTGTPSAPCLRMNAFCGSENFDVFIVIRSSQPRESGPENHNKEWSSLMGADHAFTLAGWPANVLFWIIGHLFSMAPCGLEIISRPEVISILFISYFQTSICRGSGAHDRNKRPEACKRSHLHSIGRDWVGAT
jgi:hypothetical protein